MNQQKARELRFKFFGKGGMPMRSERKHIRLTNGQVICDDPRRTEYRRAKKDL